MSRSGAEIIRGRHQSLLWYHTPLAGAYQLYAGTGFLWVVSCCSPRLLFCRISERGGSTVPLTFPVAGVSAVVGAYFFRYCR